MEKIIFSVSVLLFFFSHSLSSQSQKQLADSLYYHGKDLYYDGDYKKAKIDLEKALQIRIEINGEVHKDVVKTYFRLGKTERRLRYHKASLEILKKGLSLALKVHGEVHKDVGGFYMELGNTFGQMYDLKNSKIYFEKAIEIFKIQFGEKSVEVGNMYMNIGNGQTKMANYQDAEKYHQKALAIFKESSKPNSQDFNRIYNNLGHLYRKTGDYDRSIEYAHKALEIKLLNYKETHPSVPKYYSNLCKAYSGKGEFKKGLLYAEKVVKLHEIAVGKDHPETAGSYGALAHFYTDLGRFEEALELHQKSLGIMEKRLSLTHPYVVSVYNNVGRIYEKMHRYDEALNFYQKSIDKYESHEYQANNLIAQTYGQKANVFAKKNELDAALVQIGKGMEKVAIDFEYKNKDGVNPSFSQVQAEVDFLDLLELKSEILEKRFLKNKQRFDIENALTTLEFSIKLIEKMRRSFQSESSQQNLNERVSPIFELAVRVAFQLYELTNESSYLLKALNFSEKSKASILWQNMNKNFALENAEIPQEELDALENLGFEIQDVSEKIFESSSSEKKELQNQLFDLKLKYENQISSLEKFNPAYFKLKYASPDEISEDFINDKANESTAWIEYFYDHNNIYTFVISNGELQGFQNPFSKKIEQAIQYLRDYKISNSSQDALKENERYIAQLNFLYQELITPVENELNDLAQLIIVPHGVLNYLPFEMLSPKSNKKDFRQLPYLIRDHNIQYAWSFAFLEQNKFQQRNYKFDYLGFAPSFGNEVLAENNFSNSFAARANLAELNFTESEILKANDLFQGNVFAGENASESFFNQFSKDSKIIHLATHAFANDQQPMQSGFLFSNQRDTLEDGYLNAYEIYNMKIPAELTVMSACNTGFGQLADGEGVISLGRAFSYAGCQSVIMSLWMANDQSTASLMSHFYENLAEGNPKDMALKNAKIQYLENADPLTAHPYFWAGMVAVGNMDAISSSENNWFWWLGFGMVGLLILLVFKNINRS